ncbi:MAG: SDR family oxidoreductase [Verrucomicrobiia bacterium]|jgi:short-subunit dehydrogenase
MNAANSETVLITGASSGIGLELARCFAADGCRLILLARNTDALETLAAELRQAHKIETLVLTADLSRPDTPARVFKELQGRGIMIDVLVNNAGFGANGTFAGLPLQRQLEMIQVNITALTNLTGLFLPGMIERRRGGVLNVGSVAGFLPGPGMDIYYATKAFVLSFTEALAEELAGTGVTATALCPGPTATNFGNISHGQKIRQLNTPKMSAATVAQNGHRAFRRGRTLAIPGWQYRILLLLIRIMPRWFVRKMAKRFNDTKE